MKKRYLSAFVGLGLGMAATATAHSKAWTDVTGKHSVEAEFVALDGDKVTLKTPAGKVTTFPLANLSEADRELAKALAKEGAPAPPFVVDIKASAKAKLAQWFGNNADGEQTTSHRLTVKVDLTGGVAAEAFGVAEVVAQPATVGGVEIEPKEPMFSWGGFELIDRSKEGIFAKHPKDGVRVEVDYGEVDPGLATLDLVKGSVEVLGGGKEKTVSVGDLLTRPNGKIDDPVLAAAGLELKFTRHDLGGDAQVGIDMDEGSKVYAGMRLLGADGKEVDSAGNGSSRGDGRIDYHYSVSKKDLEGASLQITIRDGAKVLEVPFEVRDIAIGK